MDNGRKTNNSDLLLISMEPNEQRNQNSTMNGYEISDNEMVLTASSLVTNGNYNLPSIHGSNSSEEYLHKDEFMHGITDNIPLNRQAVNFQKDALPDDSSSNSYMLKSLNNDIQDLSFSVDLRTLNRTDHESPSYNYYNRSVPPSSDIYGSDFSNEFSSNNFTSMPGTSNMFQSDDTSTNYLSENQSDELLLNGIELNENEKLILSNEELAMLTQGKPGSCLELILNNGDVLYAVIDSENDYNPISPRLLQISKEILPPRQCNVPVEMGTNLVNVNEISSDPRYTCSLGSNFSKTPPITEFSNAESSSNYHSVISTALSKSIETSPINTESFNLCCNFPTDDSANHFSNVINYSSIVNEKHDVSYEQSVLRKSDLSYACPSAKDISTTQSGTKISSPRVDRIPSKLDYFPNAVNSIVVSETGKKYPKKYSFYSNNFSSFLNQDNCATKTDGNAQDRKESAENNEGKSNKPMEREFYPPTSEPQKTIKENVSVLKHTSVINATDKEQSTNRENLMKSKVLNSRTESVLNSICDRAVQSRARATLPSAYLSINRIKSERGVKKSVYGVFAKKTIPSRTQFGPVEGVLIKNEETSPEANSQITLQLTVESEKGKFLRLDVSNEEVSNWMRFVRPATSFKEQNLILSQHGSALYFTTIEVIHPKQELLVWYSVWYSQTRNYFLLPGDPCSDASCKHIDHLDDSLEVVDMSSTLENEVVQNEPDVVLVPVGGENGQKKRDEVVDSNFGSKLVVSEVTSKSSKVKGSQSKKQDKLNKSLWLCTYCDLTFSNASVMNLHILIHAADNLEKSEKAVIGEDDKNSCPQCNQEFAEKKELISHVSKHGLKVQRWSDKNVEIGDVTKDESLKTIDEFEEKTFECQPCKKKFKNPTALSVHKRFHSDDSVLECPICEITFQRLAAMREHVYNHAVNGVYTCPHCPKKYDRYKHIRKHIRACHCKVNFSCILCKKNFKSQYKLKSHMLRHSDKREFLCANCGKQFKRKDKLTEHMKNMHSEERERKSLEIMNGGTKKGKFAIKKSLKKKLPTKVLRLITENVNDFFYKCYICNIGFKRRGMLVNHLNSFHPGVSLDTVPELNVPILKAYCNFYCLYCDKVYKSNSKRKAHIIKSHPGAKIPGNLERGTVLNDPFAKHVGSVVSNPFNCEFCYRQYASRAKLLNHHRKNHADMLPTDMKSPRGWNSQKKKKKIDIKVVDNVIPISITTPTSQNLNNVQAQNVDYKIDNSTELTVNVNSQDVITLQSSSKDGGDVNQQIVSLTHLLNEELRNSTTQEQYLKILQLSNGITIAQTDENGEHPVSLENSSALLQQILASYSFSSS